MKRIFLAIAIIGMTGFAFGQQQQNATNTKNAKCSKACMKACGKNCRKGSCAHAGSSNGTSTGKKSATTK